MPLVQEDHPTLPPFWNAFPYLSPKFDHTIRYLKRRSIKLEPGKYKNFKAFQATVVQNLKNHVRDPANTMGYIHLSNRINKISVSWTWALFRIISQSLCSVLLLALR